MSCLVRTLIGTCLLSASLASASTALAQSSASRLPSVFSADQLAWSIELGDHQYTVPQVDGDRLYIGVNDRELEHPAVQSTGGGILMRLDLRTGERVWQFPIPRNMSGKNAPFHFNHWKCGVCSRPAIDGSRLYIVGPRGDLLCLDSEGQTDGNAGPFVVEKAYMGLSSGSDYVLQPDDGDIVWQYDMIKQLGVVPHDVCGSSPTVHGDYLYACTSNGMDHTHRNVANPEAPSLIVMNKITGQLVATDGAGIGERILHGQWSSPVVGTFAGQDLVLFGGGDGVLYAFRPPSPHDGEEVVALETAWQYDCCPADYRIRDGKPIPYSRWNKNSPEGPSEVIATPTVADGLIYITIGQSPVHGPGQGALSCIDGSTGQLVWESLEVGRTLSDAVVQDDLVYVADFSGVLHCFDAKTGHRHWHHDLVGGVWCATPLVADGKVFIGNEKHRMWVLKAGREKVVLNQGRSRSAPITPVVAENLLLMPTQRALFALRLSGIAPRSE